MKRVVLILFSIGLFLTQELNAQQTQPITQPDAGIIQPESPLKIIDVYERIHVAAKKPVPYIPIREADVMWAKDIWRIIDLREKMNQSLYYPKSPIGNRKSFFSAIMEGIRTHNLHAFKDDKYNLFSTEAMVGEKEIIAALGADTLFAGTSDEEIRLRTDLVKKLLVKEKWFFDQQHSTLQVRIVGIAPLKVYNKTLIDADGNVSYSPEVSTEVLFWIYFPEYRELLANNESFNPYNDAQNISFDDIFIQRRFSSFIFGESNVYDNRFIPDYMTGDDILYEAERIKQSIFEFEHDLWEY